jgi:hypothetical protein
MDAAAAQGPGSAGAIARAASSLLCAAATAGAAGFSPGNRYKSGAPGLAQLGAPAYWRPSTRRNIWDFRRKRFIVTIGCGKNDIPITFEVLFMNDKKLPDAPGPEMASEWLQSIGGEFRIGAGKLKSAKLSKKGDRLTLVIKKKSTKEKVRDDASS